MSELGDELEYDLGDAVLHNDITKVKELLEKGARVNAIVTCDDYWIDTMPLMIACNNGNKEIAELLINKGANVNWGDDYACHTPLTLGCCSGNKELVELLIEKGADVKYKDYCNDTPLKICKRRQEATKDQIWSEIIELLEKNGAKQ